MNSNKKTARVAVTSQHKAARVAGFMFLFTTVTAMFSSIIRSNNFVYGNAAETASKIMASEGLFRIGATTDLLGFAFVVILNLAVVWRC